MGENSCCFVEDESAADGVEMTSDDDGDEAEVGVSAALEFG